MVSPVTCVTGREYHPSVCMYQLALASLLSRQVDIVFTTTIGKLNMAISSTNKLLQPYDSVVSYRSQAGL